MATVPSAFLSKSPKPKRARARVTIFVTRARAPIAALLCLQQRREHRADILIEADGARLDLPRDKCLIFVQKKRSRSPVFCVICGV